MNLDIKPGPSFVSAMALAVHRGIKTQTRRVILPQPVVLPQGTPTWYPSATHGRGRAYDGEAHFLRGFAADFAPYKAGERYYLREPIRRGAEYPGDFDADLEWDDSLTHHSIEYVCDGAEHPDAHWVWKPKALPGRYMPKGLRRLVLEVVSVRVERLHAITEEDARAEGITMPLPYGTPADLRYAVGFRVEWDTINRKRAPWESNPWVWRIEFRPEVP